VSCSLPRCCHRFARLRCRDGPERLRPGRYPGCPGRDGITPLVGTWQQHDLESSAATGFVVFHADGTVVATRRYREVALGIWRPTGKRTAELVLIELLPVGRDTKATPDGEEIGTITYQETVTIDETGNTLSFEGTYDTRDASAVSLGGPLYVGSLTLAPATRVTFDQYPMLGSTTATTPAA
jgi:hypothetical protein